MSYFDDQLNNQNDAYDDDYTNEDEDEDDDGYIYTLDDALNVNKKNEQEYLSMVEKAKVNQDDYLDSNNFLVKLLLFILFVVGIIGAIYYIMMWFNN